MRRTSPPLADVARHREALEGRGTPVRLAEGRTLAAGLEMGERLLLVREGVLALEVVDSIGRDRILEFLYPGDTVSGRVLHMVSGAGLRALCDSVLARIPESELSELSAARSALALVAAEAGRLALNGLIVALPAIDARLASLLMSLTLRGGEVTAAATSLELPMSRADIASHLLLNSDTLSRAFARLRRDGVLARLERRRMLVTSWSKLAALTPLAALIERMHASGALQEGRSLPRT